MPAFSSSGVIVEVEVDREKVLARGARCVSFSSNYTRVSIMIQEGNGEVTASFIQRAAVSTLLVTGEAEQDPERTEGRMRSCTHSWTETGTY